MSTVKKTVEVEGLCDLIIDAIQDVKGKNVVKLDLRKLEASPADYFIVCEGDSSTQVRAISGKVHKRVKDEMKLMPNHTEGKDNGQWVLVDYFNVIVHIFYPEAREFYELEDLWSDAEVTHYENL